jgi:drug/metabolite transporter (DMT)-like permease
MAVTSTTPAKIDSTLHTPLMQHSWGGWALAFAATLAFSFAPPIARSAIQAGLDPTGLVVARLLIAALLVGGTIALTDRSLLKIDRRGLAISCIAGCINAVGMLLFFWALTRVHASLASMIISISPLVVLSLLALRGEKFTYRHAVRLALGIGGVYLVIGPGGQVNMTGVLLLLLSVLCFATHMVLLQWYLRGYDARTATFYISVSMALLVSSWWLVQGAPWHAPDVNGWLEIGALALICTYMARLALVAAVGRIGGGQMALLAPLETLCTVTWSMLFLDERLTPLQWLGGALILTSALFALQRLGRARWRPRWRMWTRA